MRLTRNEKLLILLLVAVSLAFLFFRPRIRAATFERRVVQSETPSDYAFREFLVGQDEKTRMEKILRLWNTRKIAHRYLVANYWKDVVTTNAPEIRAMVESIREGTRDPDASVRELCLATLCDLNDERTVDLSVSQLQDPDPGLRLFALGQLRKLRATNLVAGLIEMTGDADIRVATTADALLRSWTGRDFGVRIGQSISLSDEDRVTAAEAEIREKLQAWRTFGTNGVAASPALQATSLEAADFVLENLQGQKVRLSDYRGKTVLLNFWATWCPACLTEFPALIRLQAKNKEHFIILAIALDAPGESHEEEQEHAHGDEHSFRAPTPGELQKIRETVQETARRAGLEFPVLLDSDGSIGRRFNGQELPTNVLIDREGKVRRRFIGSRPFQAWESILKQIEPPSRER